MHQKWTRLSTETVLTTPYYTVSHDRYVLPTGDVGHYHYIDIAGSAMVVPVLDSGELVLVRQHRYLMRRDSLEFPAGGMKQGSEALCTAQEELREEAGYLARTWERIGQFAPYNGASNEMCQVFVARGLEQVGAQPDPTEEMALVLLTPDALREGIARGEVWDGMTLASFHLFQVVA